MKLQKPKGEFGLFLYMLALRRGLELGNGRSCGLEKGSERINGYSEKALMISGILRRRVEKDLDLRPTVKGSGSLLKR